MKISQWTTAQRNALTSTLTGEEGILGFNKDKKSLDIFHDNVWDEVVPISEFVSNITSLDKLPAPVGGIIELSEPRKIYAVYSMIDLQGNELRVTGEDSTIVGFNQETTGFINGTVNILNQCKCYLLRFENIEFSISSLTSSYDWSNINFYDCNQINITNAGFLIWDTIGFINSYNLNFSGVINTFVLENSIFRGVTEPTATFIKFNNGLEVQGRIRLETSRFITSFVGQKAIDFGTVTIGNELFESDKVFFQGIGTALTGINGNSLKALFTSNKGGNVINSTRFGNMYVLNNITPTTITTRGVATKVIATFIPNTTNQKWKYNAVDNTLEYEGETPADFNLNASFTVLGSANKVIGGYICLLRFGNTLNPVVDRLTTSEAYIPSATGSRPDTMQVSDNIKIFKGDKLYLAIENETDETSLTFRAGWITTQAISV